MNKVYDFVIIGGGVIGITIARELSARYKGADIAVLEKENYIAQHASGRNSGVLHSGFYYTSDSLKARYCAEGNRAMKRFCKKKELKINECGKIVVAKNKDEIKWLYELEKRGRTNGVKLKIIEKDELKEINPFVFTCDKALYSPETAVVDPIEICKALMEDAKNNGVEFFFNTEVVDVDKGIVTSGGKFESRYFINCAGLHADKIAKKFDVNHDYMILPFKGLYYTLRRERSYLVNSNIYSVPDLKNPFLGVHFTKNVDGSVKVGPTAMPVLGRENYNGIKGVNLKDALKISYTEIGLFLKNEANFRSIAKNELRKYMKNLFVKEAKKMLPNISNRDFIKNRRPGLRAQLMDLKNKKLVDDFVILHKKNSTHILNAVSPAFTCSLPFAKHVVNEIEHRGVL